jgi:hypothetical protein
MLGKVANHLQTLLGECFVAGRGREESANAFITSVCSVAGKKSRRICKRSLLGVVLSLV